MLTMRDAQVDAMIAAREARLLQRLTLHVVRYFPAVAAVTPRGALEARVARAVARARAEGVVRPDELCLFVNVCAVSGWLDPHDDGLAWADVAFGAGGATASERLRAAAAEAATRLERAEAELAARASDAEGRGGAG